MYAGIFKKEFTCCNESHSAPKVALKIYCFEFLRVNFLAQVVDENGGDVTTCTTPDWDKHSSGNISEVSVACLQDKINQMQETHYR